MKKQFDEFDLHIILVLSNNYYESVASMNEMGAACDALDGTIIKTSDLSGEYIQVRDKDFITSQNRREMVKWTNGLDELVKRGFVEVKVIREKFLPFPKTDMIMLNN